MMDGNHSGVTWFDEDRWIGSEVTFGEPHPSRWRLNRKLAESEDCATESDVKECMMASEARGVFVCSSINDPTQEAVVKIRMQYASLVLGPRFSSPNRFYLGYHTSAQHSSLVKRGQGRQSRT